MHRVSFLAIFLLFGFAHAQVNTWLNLHSCNACFGPGLCINEMDNLSSNCTSCLERSCENDLGLHTFATLGVACIQRVWNDPNQCQSVCPPWTIYDYVRSHRCSLCLLPCVGTLLDQGAGQCSVTVSSSDDPCVSENKLPCGTCYRANKCFTQREFDDLGGFCKGYLELKCPGLSNVTCVENAFAEPCSTCPRTSITDGRFQACKLCMDQCETKQTCINECKANVTTYPSGVSCTLCRAFCAINPTIEDCESKYCDCSSCDVCHKSCSDLPGDDFNLFNPCKCLNDERFAPVVVEESDEKILGGTASCEGDWPWMAYMFRRGSNPFLGGFCGGTLFNNKWLITAAHCIETNDPDLYSVVMGEYDLNELSGKEVFRNVSRIEKHPFFDPLTFDYDVAVVELSEEVTFNKYIQPLAIAAPGTPTDSTFPPSFAGSLCTTVGWGHTTSPGGSVSNVLNQLSLRITPRVLCEIQTLQDYDQGPVITSAPKFCAGSLPGEDTCQGDSGGPLFCLQPDGTYLLHGITSYGTQECGLPGRPGIYTKVGDVSTWINLCISSNHCSL